MPGVTGLARPPGDPALPNIALNPSWNSWGSVDGRQTLSSCLQRGGFWLPGASCASGTKHRSCVSEVLLRDFSKEGSWQCLHHEAGCSVVGSLSGRAAMSPLFKGNRQQNPMGAAWGSRVVCFQSLALRKTLACRWLTWTWVPGR